MKSASRKTAVAEQLGQILSAEPRRTLAVAESLTAGHVQAKIAAVSGSSRYFVGGITTYSLAQKVKHLGVDRALAKRVNSVSAEVAEQMAKGVCALFGADLAIATTGYAEPSSADDVSVPFAWWALAQRHPRGKFIVRHGRVECPGCNRTETQAIVADAALAELVSWLRE